MAKHSILLVDDEWAVLGTLELILGGAGYSVSTAANADDASRLLNLRDFDLILLDCIPGHEKLVQEAKDLNANMRVAVCTGDPGVIDLWPADIVLHKPTPPPVLLTIVAGLLRGSKAA